MTPRPRIDWPAQTPPDDFADRVVAAALSDRVAVAQDEPVALGTGDLSMRNSLQPRARAWRGWAGWLVAAAFGMMFFAGIVAHNKTQEAARQQAIAAITAQEEEHKLLKQQMAEAQAKIDALVDQLTVATNDAQRAELKRKIEEEKNGQRFLASRAGGGEAPPPAPAAAPVPVAAKRSAGGAAAPAAAAPPPAAKAGSKPTCKCQPNDPLCTCL